MNSLNAAGARALVHATRRPERMALAEVVRMAEKRIRLASGNGDYDCVYEVADFLPDVPPYAPARLKLDLMAHLRQQNFYCIEVPNRGQRHLVYISWK
jgi:hypothetical protein